MGNDLTPQLAQFLLNRPYHAIFLFVHPEIQRLHAVSGQLYRQYDWPSLSLSNTLSLRLLDVPPPQRPSRIPLLLTEILHAYAPGPLLCTDICLLFEPNFHLNPLHLFREISKTVFLIIPWPGSYQNHILAYATPLHTHYRSWSVPDLAGQVVHLPSQEN
jgi:hypothetical protein